MRSLIRRRPPDLPPPAPAHAGAAPGRSGPEGAARHRDATGGAGAAAAPPRRVDDRRPGKRAWAFFESPRGLDGSSNSPHEENAPRIARAVPDEGAHPPGRAPRASGAFDSDGGEHASVGRSRRVDDLRPRRRPRLALTRRVDPAPSRTAYRARRAWRRTWVRRLVRRGLPGAALAGVLALWLGDGEEVRAVAERWAAIRAQIEMRPEFAVTTARIEGAGPALAHAIEAALPELPSSTLSLDPEALRVALAEVPAVASATVRFAPEGVLLVRVVEREPVALWRGPGGLRALDVEGRALRSLETRTAHPDLPLIAGEGADRAVAEALALHEVAGPLEPVLRGLVRVGERRWDAVIEDGPRIMLPERGAVAAFERVAAWEAAEDLTGRDATHLDLRDPSRPVLRLGRAARAEMARVLEDERAGTSPRDDERLEDDE